MAKLLVGRRITRFHKDGILRRRVWLGAAGVLVLLAGVAAVVATPIVLSASSATLPDRIAEVGDIFAGTTLLLAVAAALIALRSYAVSTGVPDLKLRVCFESSAPNQPVFKAVPSEDGLLKAERSGQTVGTISVRNDSSYPAKGLAVIVRLEGMAVYDDGGNLTRAGWVVNELVGTSGITVVQWDAGPEYSIYGQSIRRLPVLDLTGLCLTSTATSLPTPKGPAGDGLPVPRRVRRVLSEPHPRIWFELFADGVRKVTWIPVDFTADEESQFPAQDSDQIPSWL